MPVACAGGVRLPTWLCEGPRCVALPPPHPAGVPGAFPLTQRGANAPRPPAAPLCVTLCGSSAPPTCDL